MKKTGIGLSVLFIIIALVVAYFRFTGKPSLSDDITEVQVIYQDNFLAERTQIDKQIRFTSKEEIDEIKKMYHRLNRRKSLIPDRGYEKNGKLSYISVMFFFKEKESLLLSLFENGDVYIDGFKYINLLPSKNKLELYEFFKEKLK